MADKTIILVDYDSTADIRSIDNNDLSTNNFVDYIKNHIYKNWDFFLKMCNAFQTFDRPGISLTFVRTYPAEDPVYLEQCAANNMTSPPKKKKFSFDDVNFDGELTLCFIEIKEEKDNFDETFGKSYCPKSLDPKKVTKKGAIYLLVSNSTEGIMNKIQSACGTLELTKEYVHLDNGWSHIVYKTQNGDLWSKEQANVNYIPYMLTSKDNPMVGVNTIPVTKALPIITTDSTYFNVDWKTGELGFQKYDIEKSFPKNSKPSKGRRLFFE